MSAVIDTIDRCAADSHAGARSFGAIVMELAEAGVEAYYADYRAGTTVFYLPDGSTHGTTLHAPKIAIAGHFDDAALVQAIRGAQSGAVKYPEFLQRTMQAGCVGYHVWISGRHVVYYGRRGEQHVEKFPD